MLYHRRTALKDRILIALRQAMAEGRLDVADHLLRAIEILATGPVPGSVLAEAYLAVATSSAPSTSLNAPEPDIPAARPRRSSTCAAAHPGSGGRRRPR